MGAPRPGPGPRPGPRPRPLQIYLEIHSMAGEKMLSQKILQFVVILKSVCQ